MKADLRSRGQMFIVVLIVLVLGVLLIMVVVGSFRSRQSPVVLEAFWQIHDAHVTDTTRGEEVLAHVLVEAREEYIGSILVKIRKDVAWWLDTDYQFSTFPVNLRGGQTTELELSFVPDQAGGGRFRGYFIEVDFQVTGSKWVMEDSYPPRLKIFD